MTEDIKQESSRSTQQKYQSWANTKRTNREFEVMDQVFVRVKTKRNTLTLTYGKYKKLNSRYCDPYTITKKVET
jgi:hypothetical protein